MVNVDIITSNQLLLPLNIVVLQKALFQIQTSLNFLYRDTTILSSLVFD